MSDPSFLEALAPEADLFGQFDPVSFGEALLEFSANLATHPAEALSARIRFWGRMAAAAVDTASVAFGFKPSSTLQPRPKDRRFSDSAWEDNPFFFAHRQAYLAWAEYMRELAEVGHPDEVVADKASFAIGLLVDAMAPSNFLPTNPVALRKAVETGGVSLLKGFLNFVEDVATNRGLPRQVDKSAFQVGENIGCTPGKIVFRNELMELIQYEPQTEKVGSLPLLLSPPWINRYYIMDLAPGRSFVEWAVQHGHTVFAISYRNPDASMRGVALDDYLIHGPRQALDVVCEITGSEQVNIVGLCIGGTLTAALLAYLASEGDKRVRSATLLNTLVDFSDPGPLRTFTDPSTIRRMEQRMAQTGFLDEHDMATTFNLLRPNDLIWNYVTSNWLLGEDPPAFDILAWNAHSTRMPSDMYLFYLRSCYERNELAQNKMELAGTQLHLDAIESDVYVLAAKEDHITPWKAAYRTTQLLQSPRRFVLTSSGHVAGIVNPPGPKRKYWTNDELPPDPEEWLDGATEHSGSWWEDWTQWIADRAGERREPPPMGSDAHPVLDDAPGTYVHG
ncbi:MAG: class I poly(R)-hydroxyalkanoic acid synthase [Actinomycetota bacterium]|nr:class I poly(R)-hydroxyalkanoic acid synthase [Actinomycetota bacterium]